MYVTDLTAECCNRWYSKGVGVAGWTVCHGCKQPLSYRPIGTGVLISRKELREQPRRDSRRRRDHKQREKAFRRAAREAAVIRERFPLFAEQFIEKEEEK